jgi:hypothetical protein
MTWREDRRRLGVGVLRATAAAVILLSVAFLVGRARMVEAFQRVYFDADPPTGVAEDHLVLTYGVLGAVMIGWMVLVIAVVAGPLQRGDDWAWRAVAASVAVWFVLDTAHSLAVGVWENAVLNVVAGFGFVVGLVLTRPGAAGSA